MSRDATHPDAAWTVIIPVKDTQVAKTRLRPLGQRERSALALAFVLDAATAALGCAQVRRVVAVTNDVTAAAALESIGASIVPDQPARDLNAALAHGARWARLRDPAAPVAALQGDLPAVRSEDLATVFARAGSLPTWFVTDTEGSGTTMLGSWSRTAFRPAFGPASSFAHRSLGGTEIVGDDLDRLRRDVDTEDHLRAVVRLGVGPHTRAAFAELDAVLGPPDVA